MVFSLMSCRGKNGQVNQKIRKYNQIVLEFQGLQREGLDNLQAVFVGGPIIPYSK